MSQEYQNISVTEKVYDSLPKLLERDETGATLSAGTNEPQNIASWMLGRVFLKTDSKTLKYLSSIDPITWTLMLDFSQPLATLQQVTSGYQPLNSNLTALSQLVISANTIPYFNSATSMSLLQVTDFTRSLFECEDADDVRTLLNLGNLSIVNSINSSNVDTYIADGSLPISKFNFRPITSGEGYTVGDVKETYEDRDIHIADNDGWCILNRGYTIGALQSGSTYWHSTDKYWPLYSKIWGLSNVYAYDSSGQPVSKGSSASNDWNANKRLSLPSGTNYLNSNCFFELRWL